MSAPRNTSVSSTTSSLRSALGSIKSMASEHHKSVNGAYSLLHGGPRPYDAQPGMKAPVVVTSSRSSSVASSQKSSTSSRRLSSAWESVKKAAKEHHQGVNAAYSTYYGAGVKA